MPAEEKKNGSVTIPVWLLLVILGVPAAGTGLSYFGPKLAVEDVAKSAASATVEAAIDRHERRPHAGSVTRDELLQWLTRVEKKIDENGSGVRVLEKQVAALAQVVKDLE